MTREKIEAKVRKIVAEAAMEPEEKVRPNDELTELHLDSLDRVEIVMDCEEEFSIEITDAEAEGVKRVDQLVDLVERLLAPAREPVA